jgi:hypothetical protein
MKKSEYKSLANKIEFLHILIFFVSITAMVTIFASESLKISSSIWLAGLWLVEKFYGNCPLTIEEYKLRKKAGQKIKKTKFIPRFLKKYFHLKFSDRLANLWLTLYFFISIFVLIKSFT